MQTDDLLQRWVTATQQLERRKSELNRAESELANAQNALGKHLTPADADTGESFHIWVNGKCVGIPGDLMVSVTVKSENDFAVKFRETRKAKAAE